MTKDLTRESVMRLDLEQLRLAVLAALGWTWRTSAEGKAEFFSHSQHLPTRSPDGAPLAPSSGDHVFFELNDIPNYSRSAEDVYLLEEDVCRFGPEAMETYAAALEWVVFRAIPPECPRLGLFYMAHASPEQKCRAWLFWKYGLISAESGLTVKMDDKKGGA